MLPSYEMKTTHKFNGRKGVEDEVLEFPLRIMQSNIGNERFSHPGPKAQALPGNNRNIIDLVPRQNWGPSSQGSWEQMQKHALIPRLYLGPNPQGLWEQTTTSTITPGGPGKLTR